MRKTIDQKAADLGTAGPAGGGGPADPEPDRRRWAALVFVALAQLMVALDATIVNIALPSAQTALHISDGSRQWVVTAYSLAFGGLLLLGGRIADLAGRKRTFLIGLAGFAGASALGGVAPGGGLLIAARGLQGGFGAMLTPAALSLLAVTFVRPGERARAFAVYGGIAGSGGAAGLILGGVLAENLSWRWCLYVNVPIAVVAAAGAWLTLHDRPARGRVRPDVPGALLVTGGLVAVVYGCAAAVDAGWGSGRVVAALAAGVVLLAGFALLESRVGEPLLPPRIVLDRNRGGACIAVALAVAGMFGLFLFLTYYFQVVQAYSPVRTGLAFLPLSAAVLFGAGAIATRLQPRVPPRWLIVPGLAVAAVAMALLTRLSADGDYLTGVLPAEILLGLGMSCVFVPAMSLATQRVGHADAGVAAAMINTAQQIGASLGTALLNTIAAHATARYLATHAGGSRAIHDGLVSGYALAAGAAAAILVVAGALVAVLVDAPAPTRGDARRDLRTEEARS